MASYITERVFGQIPMSARIVIPEDLSPVLKAVKEIPADEDSTVNDIVQLISEQPGYNLGHYYQYLKDIHTGVYSWVDISTNIPTGKQAGAGFYVHVGSRAFLMWVDPPGTIGKMRPLTSDEIDAGPHPSFQYYTIVDISPDSKPNSAYAYRLAGEDGFLEEFDPAQSYYIAIEANGWVGAEVFLADVNGIIIEGEAAIVSTDRRNEYANDGCGVTHPRLNTRHLSEKHKFILREYFQDGSYVDSVFQPFQLEGNPNTLFFQSDWNSLNKKSIDYIRNKPLLLRKFVINTDGDLIAFADDEQTLKQLYIDDNGFLIFGFSDDEEEESDLSILERCAELLNKLKSLEGDMDGLSVIIDTTNHIVDIINDSDSGVVIQPLDPDVAGLSATIDKVNEIINLSVRRGALLHG